MVSAFAVEQKTAKEGCQVIVRKLVAEVDESRSSWEIIL